MTYRKDTKTVLYRSRMNPVLKRNTALFPVLEPALKLRPIIGYSRSPIGDKGSRIEPNQETRTLPVQFPLFKEVASLSLSREI